MLLVLMLSREHQSHLKPLFDRGDGNDPAVVAAKELVEMEAAAVPAACPSAAAATKVAMAVADLVKSSNQSLRCQMLSVVETTTKCGGEEGASLLKHKQRNRCG